MKTFREIERQMKTILRAKGHSELNYIEVAKVFKSLNPSYSLARKFVEKYSPSRSFYCFHNLRNILN